jgi:polygalacturonase
LNTGYETQPGGGGGRNIQFLRPSLMEFFQCEHIVLSDFTLQNSPFWTLHPIYCDVLTVRGLHIVNPPDAPNTDGIDIDSCQDVVIESCVVSVGDDGIALKSGSGQDGLRVNKPTRRITVRDCSVANAHGGIVVGSETAGGISDVTVENCEFTGTDSGIRIKTRRGRGGLIRDFLFKNITMKNNLCPLVINMYYRCGGEQNPELFSLEKQTVGDVTPSIKNITFSDITATGCKASAGFIAGLPEMPVEKLSIHNCVFSTDESSGVSPDESDMFLGLPHVSEKSFRILNVSGTEFANVSVTGPAESFIYR